jgi:signal transduction histidine kinase
MARYGLRAQVAAALVVTAAVALLVAAIALLSPLEHKLRTQQVRDLASAAAQSRPTFREVDSSNPKAVSLHIRRTARRLATITGARVAVLDAHRHVLFDTDPDQRDTFRDVRKALATDRPVRRVLTDQPVAEARVALRFFVHGHRYVVALRKPLTEVRAAAVSVRSAFLTAAIAALAVALLLAAVFSATVGRRLGRLRSAVRRFALGDRDASFPHGRAIDEVGDLSRAFADMAARLRQEEELRREFVSTASHELRTPLMSLEGRLELLGDELARPAPDLEDGRRQLADARVQAARLSRLAADLLDLSRLDAGVELRTEPVDMAELVRAVTAEFSARTQRHDTPIEVDVEPVRADADPTATARVLRIVLDNALRASPDGTPIDVAVVGDDGWVRMTVTDHGAGIAAADRERIFQRFVRGARTNQSGGFGLGLAIGRELSERMGGQLALERSDESGSVFALRLPRTPNGIPT